MGVRAGIVAVLLLAFASTTTHAKEQQWVAKINGRMTVDLYGNPKNIILEDDLNDRDFRQLLVSHISKWTFYPVTVNAEPVETSVPITFNVIAIIGSDRKLKKIEFDDIRLGSSSIEDEINARNPIKPTIQPAFTYPVKAMRNNVEAIVDVVLDIGADGTVKNADVYEIALINADYALPKDLESMFRTSALRTAKKYRWTPQELAARDCAEGCIRLLPVTFVMPGRNSWKSYLPMPVKPIPWVIASELEDADTLDQSQIVRLKEDPSGKPIDLGG